MCRILASISKKPISLEPFLISHRCSLLSQSTANKEKLQKDGWGIAWFDGSWHLEKSQNPVFEEKEALRTMASEKYSLFIAHIRKASNPMNLPVEELRAYENTQPFSYRNFVFAHNGQINHPDRVKESMGEWADMVKGINDSEVYFWLLMKYIHEKGDVVDAIKAVLEHLNHVWKEIPENERSKAPYSALNMVLSDGERLYAYCKYDGRGKESLCFRDRPYYQMQYLERDGGLIIASERTSDDEWKPLEDGKLLIVEKNGDYRILSL